MKILELNGLKYSREQFDGYEYRIKIEILTEKSSHVFEIYTTDTDKFNILKVLSDRKSDEVIYINFLSMISKKQDEETSKFLDEILT